MSNFIGQADFANLAHRHHIFTDPGAFNSYLGVNGEVAYLLCNGYLIGAIFNGVCPGGVARWKMVSGDIPLDEIPSDVDQASAIKALQDALATKINSSTYVAGQQEQDSRIQALEASTVDSQTINAIRDQLSVVVVRDEDFNFDNPFGANQKFVVRGYYTDMSARITMPTDGGVSTVNDALWEVSYRPVTDSSSDAIGNNDDPMAGGHIHGITLMEQTLTILPKSGSGVSSAPMQFKRLFNTWDSGGNYPASVTWQDYYDSYEASPPAQRWSAWVRVY